jgi:uncharacterized membrane protein YjgN (DUF898 family)
MTVDAAPAQAFAHSGKFFNVLGLALKNAGLTIVTLTLYRFWARTSMRRRLWSRAWIMGDALEYTGTSWELLRGFLISLPCFFLPAIFILYIAPLMMQPVWAAWLTFGFYVVSVPLVAAARYWMRRYQLTRTRWRGIRLGLDGSAWKFAGASWGWWVLQTLSLYWYTPAARMNRARLMWSNTRFGDRSFTFIDDSESPQKGLWLPFALGWFGFLIATFVSSMISFLVAAVLAEQGVLPRMEDSATNPAFSMFVGGSMIVLIVLLSYSFWAPYRAAAMNRIASLIELDGARFRLKAKTFSLLFVQIAGWLLIIPSLGLLAPVAGFLQVRYVMNRLEIIGAPRFAEIGQPVSEAPRAGESFADAFDLDMGVGII